MKIEKVLVEQPIVQSRAALILLKRKLFKTCAYYGYQGWLRFRAETLTQWEKERGFLECFYCKKKPLIVECYDKDPMMATLDHVIPRSRYSGSKFDLKNLVVACSNCNRKKKDKTVEEFLRLNGTNSIID